MYYRLENSKIKLQTCKPDSVHGQARDAIIYLRWRSHATCICLPSVIGRAALNRPYTWRFSTQGLPFYNVTITERGLLPHIFTLTLCRAVIFCGTFCTCYQAPPVRWCVALCCPDFPRRDYSQSDSTVCSLCKS